MKRRFQGLWAALLSVVLLLVHLAQAADVASGVERIVLVGDSTVASQSGWGDAFAKQLLSNVDCQNMGRGGRSSKSYHAEGHWKKAIEAKPTWVLIQFGHNDQPGKGPERETDAKTTFRENLTRYVSEARASGAKPVLVTSLTRRTFNAQGKIQPDLLADYVAATRAVATELKVPLLDLNARSVAQMNELGPGAAAAFDPKGKDPTKPDRTHLSAKGAEATAKLIAEEIQKQAPELAKLLKPQECSSRRMSKSTASVLPALLRSPARVGQLCSTRS